jgi:hypothetical protein
MPALVAGIHAISEQRMIPDAALRRSGYLFLSGPAWMAGTSPAMTSRPHTIVLVLPQYESRTSRL